MATSIPIVSAGGAAIPAIGFGTSSIGADCAGLVAHALKVGYRHIDTAQKYGTERGVGEGIRASGVARKDIFLVTKVSHEHLHAAEFERCAEGCLKSLGQDYVDLLLIHWPNAAIPLAETVGALARCKQRGLTRHIGVANFNLAMVDEVMRLSPEPIINLQTEFHPYLDPQKVLAGCKQRGIVLTGYCPLGRGGLISDPVLGEIARARHSTPAQIALRWSVQNGVVPLPRSSNSGRIAENLAIFDFELTPEEMARIAALKRPGSKIANPKGRAPAWDD